MKKNIMPCFLCGTLNQNGPHRYEGHRLPLYGELYCCDTCWEFNWDGWNGLSTFDFRLSERQDNLKRDPATHLAMPRAFHHFSISVMALQTEYPEQPQNFLPEFGPLFAGDRIRGS